MVIAISVSFYNKTQFKRWVQKDRKQKNPLFSKNKHVEHISDDGHFKEKGVNMQKDNS